jgi:hypothetical protein
MTRKLPVYVGLAIPDAKPGERATEEIGRFATIAEAEDFLATSATIDPDRLEAGDYCIDAPEEMVNPPIPRMDIAEAFQIVLDLARQNILDDDSPDMAEEVERQTEACDIIEDLAVNHYGDD